MRIILIEDHSLVGESIKMNLQKYDDIDDVTIINSKWDLDNLRNLNTYDIILMDIGIKNITGDKDGLELAKSIIHSFPEIKIVFLTGYNLYMYEKYAKKIGAYGFVSKEESTERLLDILRGVFYRGEKYFSDVSNIDDLTMAEKRIVELYCSGMSRKEVAAECNIAVSSLAVSLSRIYDKLGVDNYQEMVKRAIELGYYKITF